MACFQAKSKFASGRWLGRGDLPFDERDRAFPRLVRRKRTLGNDHRVLGADPQAEQSSPDGETRKRRPGPANVGQGARYRDGVSIEPDSLWIEGMRRAGQRAGDISPTDDRSDQQESKDADEIGKQAVATDEFDDTSIMGLERGNGPEQKRDRDRREEGDQIDQRI